MKENVLLSKNNNKIPLEFPTKSSYAYRDTNYLLLTQIIEQLSQQGTPSFIKENIFNKLQMTNSYIKNHSQSQVNNSVIGYDVNDNKWDSDNRTLYYDGVISTTNDLSFLISALQDVKFLTNRSKKLSSKRYFIFGDSGEFSPGIGYGWLIYFSNQIKVISISGNGNGYTSNVTLIPKLDIGIIMLSNNEKSYINFNLVDEIISYLTLQSK